MADPTDGCLQWVRLKKPKVLDLVSELPQLFREGGSTHLRQEGPSLKPRFIWILPCHGIWMANLL